MAKKPNILFILSDDHGAWAMGNAGNTEINTPNLDKLAANGVRFDNFFCVSPVCSPARASIVTGTIPSYHGVHDWIAGGNVDKNIVPKELQGKRPFHRETIPINYLENKTTYVQHLADNGYYCGLSGKWHLGDSANPAKGFKYWKTIARGGCHYMHPDFIVDGMVALQDEYVTDIITNNAINFLDIDKGDAPFYLSVHYTAPHTPWNRDQHPKNIWSEYEDCEFKEQPFMPTHPDSRGTCQHAETEEDRRELYKGYYTAITAMDKGIGEILDKLETQGELENTIVVFTGDNGMNLGHHGVWGKGNGTFPFNMYDTSVKVPFIISSPRQFSPGQCDELVSHYDIFQTLLDLVEIKYTPNTHHVGSSFLPLLTGKTDEWQKERIVVFDEYGPVRMIRSKQWKYIHRYPYGYNELYDLVHDPDEMNNLFDDPEQAERIANMKAELDSWFIKYSDPNVDGTREAVTGFGQLGLAGANATNKEVYQKAYDDKHTPIFKMGIHEDKNKIGIGK